LHHLSGEVVRCCARRVDSQICQLYDIGSFNLRRSPGELRESERVTAASHLFESLLTCDGIGADVYHRRRGLTFSKALDLCARSGRIHDRRIALTDCSVSRFDEPATWILGLELHSNTHKLAPCVNREVPC
jgi:hypothetical protein